MTTTNRPIPLADTPFEQLQQQFRRMHAKTRELPEVSWETRLYRLNQLEKMLMDNKAEIIEAIRQDFGQRAAAETTMLEFFPSLSGIRHLKKHGKRWMATKKVKTSLWFLPAKSYIQPQPLGIVGIIAPWNYPLYLIIEPLAGALVAGNRAMLKVSEAVPHFEAWLAATLPHYFADDEVFLVTGGVTTAQAFSELAFDHLFFTGSTTVGKMVMQAAAKNLTPVTLELGGKSPVILMDSTDLTMAISQLWFGKSINAGQTCIAPDYVLLPRSMQNAFIEQSRQWFAKHYPNFSQNPDYSHIINTKQLSRLQHYLDDAQVQGATLIPLMASSDTGTDEHRLFTPHLVVNAPDTALVNTQEIFGPILPLVFYERLEDAIAYVNDRDRPLALYVFGQNKADIQRVLTQTVSGGSAVNTTVFQVVQPNLPFGGVGASGLGGYHGKYSFDTFTHQKAILRQSSINFLPLMMPPYGKVFWKLMAVITRF